MVTPDLDRQVEDVLVNVVHDLRQPLGNIETSAYVLNLLLGDSERHAAQYVRTIERQVDEASRILSEAVAQLHRIRAQRTGDEVLELTKSAIAGVT